MAMLMSFFDRLRPLHLDPEIPNHTAPEHDALQAFEKSVLLALNQAEATVDPKVVLGYLLEYAAKLNQDMIENSEIYPENPWFKKMALKVAQDLFEAADHNIRLWVSYQPPKSKK